MCHRELNPGAIKVQFAGSSERFSQRISECASLGKLINFLPLNLEIQLNLSSREDNCENNGRVGEKKKKKETDFVEMLRGLQKK